jgi:hypothetical protein
MAAVEKVVPAGIEIIPAAKITLFLLIGLIKLNNGHFYSD